MSIKENIKSELKGAMKSGDTEKRDVLRMLDSMIKNVEIERNKREDGLSDEEILEVVSRAVKQRKDSIEQYTKGGREDLAEKESKEMDILTKYLPEQMSEEELVNVVKETIIQSEATNKSDMGKVMGIVMGKVKGKADGNLVREIVDRELGSKE